MGVHRVRTLFHPIHDSLYWKVTSQCTLPRCRSFGSVSAVGCYVHGPFVTWRSWNFGCMKKREKLDIAVSLPHTKFRPFPTRNAPVRQKSRIRSIVQYEQNVHGPFVTRRSWNFDFRKKIAISHQISPRYEKKYPCAVKKPGLDPNHKAVSWIFFSLNHIFFGFDRMVDLFYLFPGK